MKKRIFILSCIFFILVSVLINKNIIKYVFVNPHTNTLSLKYSTHIIKHVDKNLDEIISFCQKDDKDVHYIYKNYYGSGFIKNNPIPNDLDVSVGVFIGEYNYDGKNSQVIAQDIARKITSYHAYSHSVFLIDKKGYVANIPLYPKLDALNEDEKISAQNIESGIKKLFNNEISIIHSIKNFNNEKIKYSLVFKENEIFVNTTSPIQVYTTGIFYNKYMKKKDFPREITVVPDFFATIKNSKTGEIKKVELIEESFLGERFQISRRFFVPQVFTGNISLKYLKNLDFLNDNEKYLETRFFNYFRQVTEIQTYLDVAIDPIKLLKRLHQCADIISPCIKTEDLEKIYSDINETLNNEDIRIVNDYNTILKTLNFVTANPYIFETVLKNGYMEKLIKTSDFCIQTLAKNKNYFDEIKKLSIFQNEMKTKMANIKNEKELKELNNFINENYIKLHVPTAYIINKNIKNGKEFAKDFYILNEVFEKSGFHVMDIYRKDNNTVLIAQNDFTKKLTQKDINDLIKQNNLTKANYKLIKEKKIINHKKETLYVRLNPTKEENEYWQNVQNKLLEDKKNFKIKRKYIY